MLESSCLTKSDCDEIMKYYMPQICYGYHIHGHFEQATQKYEGLEVLHPYDLVGLQKMKFLMKQIKNDDKTGKLSKIPMEYKQLQTGIGKPFYIQQFDKWKTIVTQTWMTHLWQYINEAEATMEISDFWIPRKQRENEYFSMDILLPNIPNAKIHYKVNTYVISLSDISTLNGKELLKEICNNDINRIRKIKRPRQEVPYGWWKLWRSYLDSYIVLILKRK